jgi:hypothetical protein
MGIVHPPSPFAGAMGAVGLPSSTNARAMGAIPTRLDSKVREILEGDMPDDVKAKHYAMALKKFRVRLPVKYVEDIVDETEILESVPTSMRHKAKRLIRIVKENPHLAWNERGELIYNQTIINGSNIVELFNDIFRNRNIGGERALGWREFSEGLAQSSEISKDLVSNYASWKVISQIKRPATSLTHVRSSRTVRGRSSSSTRSRDRAPDRSYTRESSWDEY